MLHWQDDWNCVGVEMVSESPTKDADGPNRWQVANEPYTGADIQGTEPIIHSTLTLLATLC